MNSSRRHNVPMAIEVLLHYHYSPLSHPQIHAPVVKQAIERFVKDGIFMYDTGKDNQYRLTQKGTAWLNMILNTPYPEQQWIDSRTGDVL